MHEIICLLHDMQLLLQRRDLRVAISGLGVSPPYTR